MAHWRAGFWPRLNRVVREADEELGKEGVPCRQNIAKEDFFYIGGLQTRALHGSC
jgi:hypothetical protein